MKIIPVLLFSACISCILYLEDQRRTAQGLYETAVLGQIADTHAMVRTKELLEAGQTEQALRLQKIYIDGARAMLVSAQQTGISSPVLDKAILESGKATR